MIHRRSPAPSAAPPPPLDAKDREVLIRVLQSRLSQAQSATCGQLIDGEVVMMNRAVRAILIEGQSAVLGVIEQHGPEVLLRCLRLSFLAAAKGKSLEQLMQIIEGAEAGVEVNGTIGFNPEARFPVNVVFTGRARLSALVGHSVAS